MIRKDVWMDDGRMMEAWSGVAIRIAHGGRYMTLERKEAVNVTDEGSREDYQERQ